MLKIAVVLTALLLSHKVILVLLCYELVSMHTIVDGNNIEQ